jgi:hypothetical protein
MAARSVGQLLHIAPQQRQCAYAGQQSQQSLGRQKRSDCAHGSGQFLRPIGTNG